MNQVFRYLDNTYLFEDNSKVLSKNTDESGTYIVLDGTIFYPQGGGQPSDIGVILKDGSMTIIDAVAFVNGEIRHYVKGNETMLQEGDNVQLKIDRDVRLRNAKCHTAGHLVQTAIEDMPYGNMAIKGYHFSDGSYVQFTGPVPEDLEAFKEEANKKLIEIITSGHQIRSKMVNFDELKNISKNIPEYLPPDKPLRVVMIEGYENAVPCGGTHLSNSSEIEKLEIKKIKNI